MDTEVLIVGAGPTGLTLGLWLKHLDVSFRIIDKDQGPGETSRALAVQSRTLEFHRQIGIVDEVLAAGLKIEQLEIRTPAGVAAVLKFGDFGAGLSKYDFAFALPQDIHERILLSNLEKLGVSVERNTELVAFSEVADGVSATLRKSGADETVGAAYLVGCDGAHSTVRHGLRLGFPGGVYAQAFYVTDVTGTGAIPTRGMDVVLGAYGFAIIMPVRQTGSVRLIGIIPKSQEAAASTIKFEDIRGTIERDTRIKIDSVNWFSTYHVHHRVADMFRIGRIFIAGDAGHIHSPAGGQGMNTGMGDAVNLAWKLAAVLQGRAMSKILDSYEAERIAFARLLIETTDRAFRLVTSTSPMAGFFRRHIMPRVMALMLKTRRGGAKLFTMVSQIGIRYRKSPISEGAVGDVRGGDRLPYLAGATADNFAPLDSLDWQIHVYGDVNPAFRDGLARTGIPILGFAGSNQAESVGLKRGSAYLVRPDGYIALAAAIEDAPAFRRYIETWGIRPRLANPSRPPDQAWMRSEAPA
jgi:2-polyprenyl-6-methoxyphenol hydroxylase-like FAD-dependent oxidoreductase